MATININPDKGSDFTYKEGEYEAVIQAVEPGTSPTSGKDYYKFTMRGQGFGVISAFVNDGFYGRRILFELMEACGIDTDRNDVDTEEFVDKHVGIEIKQRKNSDGTPQLWEGKPQFQVSKVFTLGADDEDDDDVWSV